MKIRKIKKSDEKEVVKLLNEYDKYEYKLDKRHKPDSIKERKDFFNLLIKNKTAIGLVLEVDSKIAGFISGEERETLRGKGCAIHQLIITKDYRGKGIIEDLVKEGIKDLKKKGATYLCGLAKTDNFASIKFLEKNKFIKGFDFSWMHRKI